MDHKARFQPGCLYSIKATNEAIMANDYAGRIQSRIEKFVKKQKKHPNAVRILAEGDSWFTHGAGLGRGKSLIERLNDYATVNIVTVANPGAELEDLVERRNRDWRFVTNPDWLKGHRYDLLLFSGGGNDIVGDELKSYLKQWKQGISGTDLVKENVLKTQLDRMENQYRTLRKTADYYLGSGTPILTHGYDYAHASGRGFSLIGGILTVGPWILPSFKKKKIDKQSDQRKILKHLVDEFNKRLVALNQGGISDFHYVNLRGQLAGNDWDDELHPTAAGRDRLAQVIRKRIVEI